jgi:glutathione S-transferase
MKIYTYEGAPNPRRLAMFMKYKGIAIDTELVDMMNGQQLSDEFLQINPDGTLPALVLDDGTVLSQVVGQCVYLEELYPEKPLLGTTALEKAQVISWCHKLSGGLSTAIAHVLRNRSSAFENRALPGPQDLPQIPELVDRGLLQIRYMLPQLNAHLADNSWVAGDNFSLADIDLLSTIGFLRWIKEPIPEDCSHLLQWLERAEAKVA